MKLEKGLRGEGFEEVISVPTTIGRHNVLFCSKRLKGNKYEQNSLFLKGRKHQFTSDQKRKSEHI